MAEAMQLLFSMLFSGVFAIGGEGFRNLVLS
jgi:hypothetical protein